MMEWIIFLGILLSVYFISRNDKSNAVGTIGKSNEYKTKGSERIDEIPKPDPELHSDIESLKNWVIKETNSLIENDTTINLFSSKPIMQIGYSDLLRTIEWRFKRSRILVRDAYACAECGTVSEHLHVHHKCYIKDELPWELEDANLISVCHVCHNKIHERETIPVYLRDSNGGLIPTQNHSIFCYRCNGAGWFPQYRHVEAGVCFRCRGNCIDSTIFSNAVKGFISKIEPDYEHKLLDSITRHYSSIDIDVYRKKIRPMIMPYSSTDDDMPF
jgi:hypothetical protein